MFEKFTQRARHVIAQANREALRSNRAHIDTEHILLALVIERSGVVANVLANLEVDPRKVLLEIEKHVIVKSGPQTGTMRELPLTPAAKKVIEYAIEEARNLHNNYVGTEHLLLGLLREEDGVHFVVLRNLNVELVDLRGEVLAVLGLESDKDVETDPRHKAPESRHPHILDPLTLLIDPGTASAHDLAQLFIELSILYRMAGGSGITFKATDAYLPVEVQ